MNGAYSLRLRGAERQQTPFPMPYEWLVFGGRFRRPAMTRFLRRTSKLLSLLCREELVEVGD
jgi:hypothetical protein